jgi:hypothetical protein
LDFVFIFIWECHGVLQEKSLGFPRDLS